MNKQKMSFWMVKGLTLVLIGGVLLTGCAPRARVGELQTETQTVELGDADAVRVEIVFGAGDLAIVGGADQLLEGDFTYNVAKLKPLVRYSGGTLVVAQPETRGLPILKNIAQFRNEWDLRLNDQVPMELHVDMGAGNSSVQLADMSLTGLDLNLGAGNSTLDLSGGWARDLDVSIDVGAANLTVRLPRDVGVRVKIDAGPHTIESSGLMHTGDFYTNAAYGVSNVTLQVNIDAGIGRINLEVDEAAG